MLKYIDAFENDDQIGAAVITVIGTGLRRAEVLALKWGDYQGVVSRLMIENTLERVEGETRIKAPKSDASAAPVGIPEFVEVALEKHKLAQRERFLQFGRTVDDDTLIFDRNGIEWVPNTFGGMFERHRKRFGLPKATLHELRHTFATELFAAGATIEDVTRALRHAGSAVTRAYLHDCLKRVTSTSALFGKHVAEGRKRSNG